MLSRSIQKYIVNNGDRPNQGFKIARRVEGKNSWPISNVNDKNDEQLAHIQFYTFITHYMIYIYKSILLPQNWTAASCFDFTHFRLKYNLQKFQIYRFLL